MHGLGGGEAERGSGRVQLEARTQQSPPAHAPNPIREDPSLRPLDRIDSALVAALQKQGRIPNQDLAAEVGLSPSACLERVRRLLRDGVVRGFHADVEPRALGIGLQAMIAVRLAAHTRAQVDTFHDWALELPEVVGLYHVAGATDFLVHVVARDSDHLRSFAMEAFTTRPEVAHLETSLIYEVRRKHVLPDLLQREE
jgi:DNA-binding Lrp family transcriptional regulator